MSQVDTVHQKELKSLKACIAALRSKGRRKFPDSVKDRVSALRQAGFPAERLASELGVAKSRIYSWVKVPQATRPKVLQVEAPSLSLPSSQTIPQSLSQGALQLRWGPFCITIAVDGEK